MRYPIVETGVQISVQLVRSLRGLLGHSLGY